MKANTIIRRFGRFAACVAMLAAAACTGNFEDYNTKPFRPSDDDLNGDNVGVGILFPAMMEFVTHFQVNASQMHDVLVADELGGYTSAVKSYQGQNIATYNPSDKFNDYIFEQTFANFYGNYFKVETQTGGEGPVYQLARILRVAAMLRVTDAYGPIPYSKMQNGTFSVPYDSQRDVYMAMIDDLDAAMETLYTFASAGDGILMRDFDISSFKGDSRLWVSFANTLKLRMAIRMSGVEPEARRIAEEAVRDMATYGLIDANAENLSFPSESVLHASDEHLLAGPAVERQHRDVHERLRGSAPGFLFFEVGLRRDLRRCACGHSECDADRLCDLLLSALRRKGPRAGDVRFGKLVPACRGRSAGLDDGRHGRKPL